MDGDSAVMKDHALLRYTKLLDALLPDAADRRAHRGGVLACLDAIGAGEVYQACVCTQFAGMVAGAPLDFFLDGVARTSPARAAYVAGPWGAVASLSPGYSTRFPPMTAPFAVSCSAPSGGPRTWTASTAMSSWLACSVTVRSRM